MTEAIVKTRGQDNLYSPVMVPLYTADLNAVQFDSIATMPVVNIINGASGKTGIRSRIKEDDRLTDIQGQRVGMVCQIGDETYRDIVTLIGTTNTGVIVEFDDEKGAYYTVRKSVARFVNGGF